LCEEDKIFGSLKISRRSAGSPRTILVTTSSIIQVGSVGVDSVITTLGSQKTPMKVLFLDVDGVLTIPDGSGRLDDAKLRRLQSVVQQTQSVICISSNCELPPIVNRASRADPPLSFCSLPRLQGVCFRSLSIG
jgi:hypothetical protein